MSVSAGWESDPSILKETIQATLGLRTDEYEVRFQSMFGGIMAYTRDRPFASLSTAGLALKLNVESRNLLIEEGGYPLRYDPEDPPSKSYTVLPEKNFGTGNKILESWVLASIDYCKDLPLKKKRKKKKEVR